MTKFSFFQQNLRINTFKECLFISFGSALTGTFRFVILSNPNKFYCQDCLIFNTLLHINMHPLHNAFSSYLANFGPTVSSSKEELAVIALSGISPDCIPSESRHCAENIIMIQYESYGSKRNSRTDKRKLRYVFEKLAYLMTWHTRSL